jgi:hypothetical protein
MKYKRVSDVTAFQSMEDGHLDEYVLVILNN